MTASGQDGLIRTAWRTSSRSSPTSNDCVEVATYSSGSIAVRDSKNPSGPRLAFSRQEWTTFTRDVKGAGVRAG
jgi:hypothetical protein